MNDITVEPTNIDTSRERHYDAHKFIKAMKAFISEQNGECFFVPKDIPNQCVIGFEAYYNLFVGNEKVSATKHFTLPIVSLRRKSEDMPLDLSLPLNDQNCSSFTDEEMKIIQKYADTKLALHKAEAEYVKLFTGQQCASPEVYDNTGWSNPASNTTETDSLMKAKMGTINGIRNILSNPFAE
jgi:hypothetical protein